MEGAEHHELSPAADSAPDKSEVKPPNDEERQKMLETIDIANRTIEEWRKEGPELRRKLKEVAELQKQMDEMIADPSSNLSPFLVGEFTDLLKVIGDPEASERTMRVAEFRARMWLAFHTSWKARQMDDRNATRADQAARKLTIATYMLATATAAVVLATIGLVIVTILQG